MHFSMLKLPCEQAIVEGDEPVEATLSLYGAVHAHDFRITLSRQNVETLRESCSRYLARTQALITDPEQLAVSVIHEVCAPDKHDPDAK